MLCCCLPSFKPARKRVVFLGLDGSGKTTLFNHLVHHLALPEGATPYVPTKLPMVATCEAHGKRLVVWDVPGSDPQTWRHFYTGAVGIVYVVDASRLAQAKRQLEELGREEQLKDALFLLVVNKHSEQQVADELKRLPLSRCKVVGSAQEFASAGLPWLCKEM